MVVDIISYLRHASLFFHLLTSLKLALHGEQCLLSKKMKEDLLNTAICTDCHLAGISGNLQALDTSNSQMKAGQINNFASQVV